MAYLTNLKKNIATLGKASWQPLLEYVADLHEVSIHPANDTFPYPWEEIGPGYCYGPAFGHWDIIHQAMDLVTWEPEHAKHQLLNNLHNQQEDGLLPGSIWMRQSGDNSTYAPQWNNAVTHPPVWPILAERLWELQQDKDLLHICFEKLVGQIQWWNTHRKAGDGGYFYTDISTLKWESGIDEGIRFLDVQPGKFTCVDATSHVFLMYRHAWIWAQRLGYDHAEYADHSDRLQHLITEELWSEEKHSFFDRWAILNPEQQKITHENFWPVIVGAANIEQSQAIIQRYLNSKPDHFKSAHAISTVSLQDPNFEQRMWRGPAWNSITWWVAQACYENGYAPLGSDLLESALDHSARVFKNTGKIWEFYHSEGGDPRDCIRKPDTPFNTPCPDYLGHNPLLAMARLWEGTA